MNTAFFMGRLTNDAEIKYTIDSKPVARFTIAVQRKFKKEGEQDTDFFKCVAFGKVAGRIERLGLLKGTKLVINCEVRNNNFTDKDGQKRYEVQLIVNEFEFCEKRAEAPTPAAPNPDPDTDFMSIADGLEEFPFR